MTKLQKYEKACNELATAFFEKYYDGKGSWYWIGDQIGGMMAVNDDFIDMFNIAETIRLNLTYEQLSAWMDYGCEGKKPDYNLRSFFKLKIYNK
jgi:hypothetical protein